MSLVDELVARWARISPEKCAIVDGDERLCYAELFARVEEQASRLADVGVGHGDRVAVVLARSSDLVVMELACLQLGAVYVPISDSQPTERTRMMIDDCRAKAIVRFARRGMPAVELGHMASPTRQSVTDARNGVDVACVMYTSGSTGVPKGVVVPHRAIASLVTTSDYATIATNDVVGFASNPAFDASTWEAWGALANGATLVVLTRDTVVSPSRLAEAIRHNGISSMFLTTSLFNHIVRSDLSSLRGLSTLLFGGEQCNVEMVQRACSAQVVKRLVHVYGPTECTTFALFHEIGTRQPDDVTEGGSTVPIGRPISGTTAHVLDPIGNVVEDGTEGELYLGGNRLAIGYLHDELLTKQRFLPDQLEPGENRRLYRTGDLVKRRPDGAVDYLGRTDRQVKVRGFRVQLEELERTASGHAAVRQAIAFSLPGADGAELSIVVESDSLDEANLRRHLGLYLPAELVPARVAVVSSMPLNENGKVDRVALERSTTVTGHEHIEVGANLADIDPPIAEAWQRALSSPIVDPNASFFDLGGSSLQAARMLAEVYLVTGVDLPLSTLTESPTLRSLAGAVAAKRDGVGLASNPAITELRQGGKPPLLVVDCYEGTAFFYRPLLQRLPSGNSVMALNAMKAAGGRRFNESVESIAGACIREWDRAGIEASPLVLIGHSSGGAIAFEMARQFLERGTCIGGVVLLDPESALTKQAPQPFSLRLQELWASRNRVHRVRESVKARFRHFVRLRRDDLRFLRDLSGRDQSIEKRSRLNRDRQRALVAKYWPQPLPARVPMQFIACTGSRSEATLKRYLDAWRPLLGGEPAHCVSGRHADEDSFLAEPHVADVASLLGKFLEGLH